MRRTRTCQHCHDPLPRFARSDAVFCSGRCRTAACRARCTDDSASAIPSALRSRARWVRHEAKRPLTVHGHAASVTNPRTWSTYAAARASTAGDGLGFVLDGDGIIGVDIDGCIGDDGGLAPWAAAILDTVPATYIEVSPSGHGLHLFGFGRLPAGRVVTLDGGGKVELYGRGRYLRMTGQAFGACPSALADLQPFIATLTV